MADPYSPVKIYGPDAETVKTAQAQESIETSDQALRDLAMAIDRAKMGDPEKFVQLSAKTLTDREITVARQTQPDAYSTPESQQARYLQHKQQVLYDIQTNVSAAEAGLTAALKRGAAAYALRPEQHTAIEAGNPWQLEPDQAMKQLAAQASSPERAAGLLLGAPLDKVWEKSVTVAKLKSKPRDTHDVIEDRARQEMDDQLSKRGLTGDDYREYMNLIGPQTAAPKPELGLMDKISRVWTARGRGMASELAGEPQRAALDMTKDIPARPMSEGLAFGVANAAGAAQDFVSSVQDWIERGTRQMSGAVKLGVAGVIQAGTLPEIYQKGAGPAPSESSWRQPISRFEAGLAEGIGNFAEFPAMMTNAGLDVVKAGLGATKAAAQTVSSGRVGGVPIGPFLGRMAGNTPQAIPDATGMGALANAPLTSKIWPAPFIAGIEGSGNVDDPASAANAMAQASSKYRSDALAQAQQELLPPWNDAHVKARADEIYNKLVDQDALGWAIKDPNLWQAVAEQATDLAVPWPEVGLALKGAGMATRGVGRGIVGVSRLAEESNLLRPGATDLMVAKAQGASDWTQGLFRGLQPGQLEAERMAGHGVGGEEMTGQGMSLAMDRAAGEARANAAPAYALQADVDKLEKVGFKYLTEDERRLAYNFTTGIQSKDDIQELLTIPATSAKRVEKVYNVARELEPKHWEIISQHPELWQKYGRAVGGEGRVLQAGNVREYEPEPGGVYVPLRKKLADQEMPAPTPGVAGPAQVVRPRASATYTRRSGAEAGVPDLYAQYQPEIKNLGATTESATKIRNTAIRAQQGGQLHMIQVAGEGGATTEEI